jgi:hypothetical protein
MKQNILAKKDGNDAKCERTFCCSCQNCRLVDPGENSYDLKNNSLQLYAKEAEGYFFYFDLTLKQE